MSFREPVREDSDLTNPIYDVSDRDGAESTRVSPSPGHGVTVRVEARAGEGAGAPARRLRVGAGAHAGAYALEFESKPHRAGALSGAPSVTAGAGGARAGATPKAHTAVMVEDSKSGGSPAAARESPDAIDLRRFPPSGAVGGEQAGGQAVSPQVTPPHQRAEIRPLVVLVELLIHALHCATYVGLSDLGRAFGVGATGVTPVYPPSGYAVAVSLARKGGAWRLAPAFFFAQFAIVLQFYAGLRGGFWELGANDFLTASINGVGAAGGISLSVVLINLATRSVSGEARKDSHEDDAEAAGSSDRALQRSSRQQLKRMFRLQRVVDDVVAPFRSPVELIAFVVAAALGAMTGAFVGVTRMLVGGVIESSAYWELWQTWMSGNATGILIVAPPLVGLFSTVPWRLATDGVYKGIVRCKLQRAKMGFARAWRILQTNETNRATYVVRDFAGGMFDVSVTSCLPCLKRLSRTVLRRIEGFMLAVALVVVLLLITESSHSSRRLDTSFATLPFIFWAAHRFGLFGAALGSLASATILVVRTSAGRGPFSPVDAADLDRLLTLDGFLFVMAAGGLLIAALSSRARAIVCMMASAQAKLSEAKRRAEAAAASKSLFLDAMSHEMRTPLNGVISAAELIGSSPDLSPEHRDSLRDVRASADHLLTVIDDILRFSRLDAARARRELSRAAANTVTVADMRGGEQQARPVTVRDLFSMRSQGGSGLEAVRARLEKPITPHARPASPTAASAGAGAGADKQHNYAKLRRDTVSFDLAESAFDPGRCVEDAVDLSYDEDLFRIPLVVRIDPNMPSEVMGDQTRIRQALVNVIGNACRYTEEGIVEVSARFVQQATGAPPHSPRLEFSDSTVDEMSSLDRIDGVLEIDVRDTGIGIPAESLDIVFEPFEQVFSGLERRFGGTGLGLAITAALVAEMRGSITVQSTEGVGSTFTVSIPVSCGATGSGHLDGSGEIGATSPGSGLRSSLSLSDLRVDTTSSRPGARRAAFVRDTSSLMGERAVVILRTADEAAAMCEMPELAGMITETVVGCEGARRWWALASEKIEDSDPPGLIVVDQRIRSASESADEPAGAAGAGAAKAADGAGRPGSLAEEICEAWRHIPMIVVQSKGEKRLRRTHGWIRMIAIPVRPSLLWESLLDLARWRDAGDVRGASTSPKHHASRPRRPGLTKSLTTQPPEGLGRRWNVLIVEDNRVNQRVMTRLLKALDVDSEVARDGIEALEQLGVEHDGAGGAIVASASSTKFDAVMMDLSMPRMDGLAATRALRKAGVRSARGGALPVIAVTANAYDTDREKALEAGCDKFLPKPVSVSDVAATLDVVLAV